MVISTQHLVPQPPPVVVAEDGQGPIVTPVLIADTMAEVKSEATASILTPTTEEPAVTTPKPTEADAPMEVDAVTAPSAESTPPVIPTPTVAAKSQPPQPAQPPSNIDVAFEASKLPLDVAIFNSARAAGGDDKIRKYLQAVLVVGGTSLVPGMAHALESRLQAIATPLVQNMEKVQIIPPPKDVDKRVLVWKGAGVLGRMEGVSELWVTGADWVGCLAIPETFDLYINSFLQDIFGMRGLRDRCFFL